jgi:DNA replication protein DnaC
MTSNLSIEQLGEIFHDLVLESAMAGRLTHKAHMLNMNGMSYRALETKVMLNS